MKQIINNFLTLCEDKPADALFSIFYVVIALFCIGVIIDLSFSFLIDLLIKIRDRNNKN